MSAWNWEPMMPTLTLPLLPLRCPGQIREKEDAKLSDLRMGRSCAANVHDYAGCGPWSSQPTNSWRIAIAFVFDFVVDADAGGVVSRDGQLL